MAERIITDGLVLVKAAPSGDITAAVTATTGWTDLSEFALTMSLDTARNAVAVNPHGPNPKSRVLPGARTGTMVLTFLRSEGASPDPADFFEGIDDANGRLQFCIQLDRSSLISGGTLTPAASASNPQYVGSAVITALASWGEGDADSPAAIRVSLDTDKDFARYRA